VSASQSDDEILAWHDRSSAIDEWSPGSGSTDSMTVNAKSSPGLLFSGACLVESVEFLAEPPFHHLGACPSFPAPLSQQSLTQCPLCHNYYTSLLWHLHHYVRYTPFRTCLAPSGNVSVLWVDLWVRSSSRTQAIRASEESVGRAALMAVRNVDQEPGSKVSSAVQKS
jgi:hypothetical protein